MASLSSITKDAYSIDRCYGDMALETAIGLLDDLE
jgi:hypothetical protein